MSDSQSAATPSLPNFQVRIPLEWGNADDIPIVYANQVMVSHAGPEFLLVFGVVLPPNAQDELPDSFVIKPQVRVVISREAMPAIVQALNDNLNRFRANLARHHQQQLQDQQQQQQAKAAQTSLAAQAATTSASVPASSSPPGQPNPTDSGSGAAGGTDQNDGLDISPESGVDADETGT